MPLDVGNRAPGRVKLSPALKRLLAAESRGLAVSPDRHRAFTAIFDWTETPKNWERGEKGIEPSELADKRYIFQPLSAAH